MTRPPTRTSYDEVPYPTLPAPRTHPDCLATAATLVGLIPPPVDRCRVLELGCGDGGNLIPMAYALPGATFVGIDASERQITDGRSVIEALGLTNIGLRHLDILDVPADLGQFDYVIAHGVYSWVAPTVQDKLLAICQAHLAPHGVAYVSYNTYPGWRMRGMIRDMMLYHTRHLSDPRRRVAEARSLLDFLAASVPAAGGPYDLLLKAEQAEIRTLSDAYLFHEFLEDVNEPVYFHQLIERAQRHGLQYLAEVDFWTMPTSDLSRELSARLGKLGQAIPGFEEEIGVEQHLDFVRNRKFRQTLLCHAGLPVVRPPEPSRLAACLAASPARPVSEQPDIRGPGVERFRTPAGVTLGLDHPVLKAAMVSLADLWPRAVPFDALLAMARARLSPEGPPAPSGGDGRSEAEALQRLLLRCFSTGLVELHVWRPPFAAEVSERPVASALARYQAARGTIVTNLLHCPIHMDDAVGHQLLPHLDGTRDRLALGELLAGLASEGALTLTDGESAVTDPERLRRLLPAVVTGTLDKLAAHALLVA
jgi:SAM-dependent methyltransferase